MESLFRVSKGEGLLRCFRDHRKLCQGCLKQFPRSLKCSFLWLVAKAEVQVQQTIIKCGHFCCKTVILKISVRTNSLSSTQRCVE